MLRPGTEWDLLVFLWYNKTPSEATHADREAAAKRARRLGSSK